MDDHELDTAYEQAVHHMWVRQIRDLGRAIDVRQEQREQRLAAPGALADAATWYAAQGIPVFPCRPRGKAPLLRRAHRQDDPAAATCRGECGRLGHGLHDATTDPEQVHAWWTATPAANIGIPTGHAFDVVDVDGPAGYASLGLLADAELLPATLGRAYTPGNPPERPPGAHYYIAPTGHANTVDKTLLPGLDFRGVGGYVLAAPSVGPTGDRYQWMQPLTLAPVAVPA